MNSVQMNRLKHSYIVLYMLGYIFTYIGSNWAHHDPRDGLNGLCGGKCCEDGPQNCSVPFVDTFCYCDVTCLDRSPPDCCDDIFRSCRRQLLKTPSERKKQKTRVKTPAKVPNNCIHNGVRYHPGNKIKVNCNGCSCVYARLRREYNWKCTQKQCLMSSVLIEYINEGAYGWRAQNQTVFWGIALKDGLQRKTGTFPPKPEVSDMPPVHEPEDEAIPDEFDARDKWQGWIHGILDQGDCASSWAFSTASVASDRLSIHSAGKVRNSLSPQHLLSCNSKKQEGCNGGNLDRAWWFMRKYGLVDATCYPYHSGHTGRKGKCYVPRIRRRWYTITCPLHQDIRWGTLKTSPPYRISSKLCANSWGKDWGEDGYFRIARGQNECQIESFVLGVWGNANPWVKVMRIPTTRTTPVDVSPTAPEEKVNLVLAVITPLSAICGIMFLIGIVLCIHVWRKGKRNYNMSSVKNTYTSHNTLDETKSSVGTNASNNKKACSSTPREYIPKLECISESPEDRLRLRGRPSVLALASEESILSVLSKLNFDVGETATNPHFISGHDAANSSQSYPTLAVRPHPPYSPYHLTWLSPADGRHVHSDPNIPAIHQRRLASVDSGSIPSSLYNHSWRSPYHPSYNTPTDPMDNNGNVIPPNMIVNHMIPVPEKHQMKRPSTELKKRISDHLQLKASLAQAQAKDELILSASKLNIESRKAHIVSSACSASSSLNTSSSCPVCSNFTNPRANVNQCDCCARCGCGHKVPSTESMMGNVGSSDTSIQNRTSAEVSFQNGQADPVCHGSCDTTHSGEHSSSTFFNSQNNSTFFPGQSHSTSIGPSNNTTQLGFANSLPQSGIVSRNASPTIIHNETVSSAPGRVAHSTANQEKMTSSQTQTDLSFDVSAVSYRNIPPPPYRPQFIVERVSHQEVFSRPSQDNRPISQDSMNNLSTDVHRSMSNVAGRESQSSYDWDAYPFYHQQSSQNSGVNSSQSSSGGMITRPVYPILCDVQHWV